MKKTTSILNTFIAAPNLKITSEDYTFENFKFSNEEITEDDFQFPKELVLGMQAEACFEECIKCSTKYKLLIANLQIHTSTSLSNPLEKKTLGELDYIIQNLKTNKVIHIELACKFYLYDDSLSTSEEEKWIGPNRKDTLYDKLEKVKWKQFPLLQKKETLQKLQELNIEIPTSQQLCLKAFLFLPKKMNRSTFPKNFQDCIVGYWVRFSEFINQDENAFYAIPTKKEWLLPLESTSTWHSFSEVKKEIEQQLENKKSPLIYRKTPRNIERFFVVWW